MYRPMLAMVRQEASSARYRARKYARAIESRQASPRTERALRLQQMRVRYFDALEAWITQDAELGALKPYLYYRSNTFLLYKHGCRPTFDEADAPLVPPIRHAPWGGIPARLDR